MRQDGIQLARLTLEDMSMSNLCILYLRGLLSLLIHHCFLGVFCCHRQSTLERARQPTTRRQKVMVFHLLGTGTYIFLRRGSRFETTFFAGHRDSS